MNHSERFKIAMRQVWELRLAQHVRLDESVAGPLAPGQLGALLVDKGSLTSPGRRIVERGRHGIQT